MSEVRKETIISLPVTYLAISENERAAVLLNLTTAAIPNLRKNCLVAGILYIVGLIQRLKDLLSTNLLEVSVAIH